MKLEYHEKYKKKFSIVNITVCVLFSALFFFDFIMQTSFSVNLNHFHKAYGLNDFMLGLLGSSFLIGYIIMQLPIGIFLSRYSIKSVMISFMIVTIIGNIIIVASFDFYTLFIGRFLTGVGCAIAYVGAAYAITCWWPERYEGFGYALILSVGSIGGFVGQDLFVTLLDFGLSWELATFLLVIISLTLLVLLIYFFVDDKEDSTCLKKSQQISFSVVKKAILNKNVILIGLLGLIANSPTSALAGLWLVPYFEINNILNEHQSIHIIAFFWFSLAVLPFVVGYLALQFSPKVLLSSFFSLVLISYILIYYSATLPNPIVYLAMMFLAVSPSIPLYLFIMIRVVQPRNYAIVFSFLNLMTMLGGMAMQPVAGFIIDLYGHAESGGYHLLLSVFAALSAICVLVSIYGIKLNSRQKDSCMKAGII